MMFFFIIFSYFLFYLQLEVLSFVYPKIEGSVNKTNLWQALHFLVHCYIFQERAEMEERVDRSWRDEGGMRGEKRNESSQRERSGQRERGEKDVTEITKQKGEGETTVVKRRGERSESSGRGERGD